MNAVWYERNGAAEDVLQYGTIAQPNAGPGQVRVKIYASGVNRADTKARSGSGGQEMKFVRIIPHQDGAGIIDDSGTCQWA
jgi:NADPH:quinone reductase